MMKNWVKQWFLNDWFILWLIIVNAGTIILQGFDEVPAQWLKAAIIADAIISILFLIEVLVKVKHFGFKGYWASGWNRMDFFLVIVSAPSLILAFTSHTGLEFSFFFTLRLLRVFKFFRFLKFIPNIEHLIAGIQRAVKASLLIFIGFFIFNLVVSLFSNYLLKEKAPEYFGNPLISFYSIFKIFTVEGWYEIPDAIAENSSDTTAVLIRIYFIAILLSGGVIGLSLVNSIFVDAMVSDNNSEVEQRLQRMEDKIDQLAKGKSEPKT